MTDIKTLGDLLAKDPEQKEIYLSESKRREARKQRGFYTKTPATFDFIFLIKCWEDIVGNLMGKNSLPLKIKYDTLYITTKHAVFSQEMGFLSQDIIKKIEDRFSSLEGKIKKIKFTNNEFLFEQKKALSITSEQENSNKARLHPFSPEYKRRSFMAEELFKHVEDEEVKKILKDFYLS